MTMENMRLAVLIDGDNAPRDCLKSIMEEIAIYGTPMIKRIYGDWASQGLTSWKNSLLENAVTPKQQFAYTTGKNATDSAMIIDAMDILYTGQVDGFVLVSSDSDFTRLAMRLREAGMRVLGMGEKKTPTPFIAACDRFIYLEILNAEKEEQKEEQRENKNEGRSARRRSRPKAAAVDNTASESGEAERAKIGRVDASLIKLIASSVDDIADENGWAFLGDVGNLIQKKQPSFDSRNYGYRKLTQLIQATGKFEIDQRETANNHIKHVYIRQIGVTDVR